MGDLLIRGVEPDLKRMLAESARRNGRNLSEEVVARLRKAFASGDADSRLFGERLAAAIGGATFSDEEIAAIEASRKGGGREPPSFD